MPTYSPHQVVRDNLFCLLTVDACVMILNAEQEPHYYQVGVELAGKYIGTAWFDCKRGHVIRGPNRYLPAGEPIHSIFQKVCGEIRT